MMTAAIHIIGIGSLVAFVGSLAYNMGLKEGARREKMIRELDAEEKQSKKGK